MSQKDFKEYYTAGEVKKILDITDGKLYNYVRYGHLERIIPPGSKQGVYKREEVERLALELNAFMGSSSEKRKYSFSNVILEDVADNVKLLQEVFGKNTGLTVENRTKWIEKNPHVSYQLSVDGDIVGCIALLPLEEVKIEAILDGKANSEKTLPEEIKTYEPGVVYHLYAMGACITPRVSKTEKRIYGSRLIRGVSSILIELAKEKIEIGTITARSETVDGIRLLRHIGFERIPSKTNNVNFRIDMNTSDVLFVQQYQRELQKAKEIED